MANKHIPKKGKPHCLAWYLDDGQAIDKGGEHTLIRIEFPKEGEQFMAARETAKKLVTLIDLFIIYKCHYGNRDSVAKRYNEVPNKLSQQDAASGASA